MLSVMLSSRSTYDENLRQFTVDSLSAARKILYSLLVLEYITNPFLVILCGFPNMKLKDSSM